MVLKRKLFKLWFKTILVFVSLFFALTILTVFWDLSHYLGERDSKSIATVTSRLIAPQHYTLIINTPDQVPIHFDLRGDMWQLDARLLVWDSYWLLIGVENWYRFERISGRYKSVKDELKKRRTLYDLSEGKFDLGESGFSLLRDFKHWLFAYSWLPGVNLLYGSSAYVPMSDGARYELFLHEGGIQVQASNASAKEALVSWF